MHMSGDTNKTDRNNRDRRVPSDRSFSLMAALVLAGFFFLARPAAAELKPMSPGDMKEATAQAGFTDFSLNNDTARLFLDIHIETYTKIAKFTAGNYNSGSDQLWSTVQLGGDVDTPLTIDGLVFMADFAEGSFDAGNTPALERIVIGSNYLNGTISGNISSFTGIYSSSVLTGGGSPDTVLKRENLSDAEFVFNSTATNQQGLFLILNIDSANNNVGVQVVAGYNETNIPKGPLGAPWWDSP
jgi:hypothetical protein